MKGLVAAILAWPLLTKEGDVDVPSKVRVIIEATLDAFSRNNAIPVINSGVMTFVKV